MQQFMNMLMNAFQNAQPFQANNQNQNQPAPAPTTFREFQNVKQPTFHGRHEPIEAKTWITKIEKAFRISRVANDQKTLFASYLMKGEANFWWEATERKEMNGKVRRGREDAEGEEEEEKEGSGEEEEEAIEEEQTIYWKRFKDLFFEKYFPTNLADRMETRFLELRQDDMTVAEYEEKFSELARFAPHQY